VPLTDVLIVDGPNVSKPLQYTALCLVLLCAASCQTIDNQTWKPLEMTYISDPAGAMVYEGEKLYGRTPITLSYPSAAVPFSKGRCLALRPVTYRWSSGAEKRIDGISACPQQGKHQQVAFRRPEGAPGLELDVKVGLQVEQNILAQQQAQAAETSAAIRALAERPVSSPRASASDAVHCTSRASNDTVTTDCNAN
jgi:hypothetical protein